MSVGRRCCGSCIAEGVKTNMAAMVLYRRGKAGGYIELVVVQLIMKVYNNNGKNIYLEISFMEVVHIDW